MPRHFQQTETRDAPDLHPGPVHFQGFAQAVFDLALIAGAVHVDEIDHDQPAYVPEPHLAGCFFGGLQVGVVRRFLDVRATSRPGRIDIDGNQCLGVVDDDGATRGQVHLTLERCLDLCFDLEPVE